MDLLKIDAPLAALISQTAAGAGEPLVDVSVRTRDLLSSEQVSELSAMGIQGADTRRKIFPARMSLNALRTLASKPWVFRVSLAQELRPLASGQEL